MKLTTFIILIALSAQALSQKVVLYSPKYTAKWPMLQNSYSFFVPNTSCDSVVFKSNNGKIEQNIHNKCRIYFTPDSLVKSTFEVYKKENGKLILIDTIPIDVIESRESFAHLGTKTGGILSKDFIIAVGGLVAHTYVSEGHAESSQIISYRIITIRRDTIETTINEGYRFNESSIALLKKLKSTDKLLFTEITIKTHGDRVYQIKSLEFQVE